MTVYVKRAYEKASPEDGIRILVDRYWPRGIKKEDLQLDDWMKELAPSNELRKWFAHDPEKFPEFEERYTKELEGMKQKQKLEQLRGLLKEDKRITLLFGARNEQHNQAVVLKKLLRPQA